MIRQIIRQIDNKRNNKVDDNVDNKVDNKVDIKEYWNYANRQPRISAFSLEKKMTIKLNQGKLENSSKLLKKQILGT